MVEFYVDDIAVKSHDKNDDLHNLKNVWYNASLSAENEPNKVLVSSDKFLGFIVTSKWIHLDPDKVKSI